MKKLLIIIYILFSNFLLFSQIESSSIQISYNPILYTTKYNINNNSYSLNAKLGFHISDISEVRIGYHYEEKNIINFFNYNNISAYKYQIKYHALTFFINTNVFSWRQHTFTVEPGFEFCKPFYANVKEEYVNKNYIDVTNHYKFGYNNNMVLLFNYNYFFLSYLYANFQSNIRLNILGDSIFSDDKHEFNGTAFSYGIAIGIGFRFNTKFL